MDVEMVEILDDDDDDDIIFEGELPSNNSTKTLTNNSKQESQAHETEKNAQKPIPEKINTETSEEKKADEPQKELTPKSPVASAPQDRPVDPHPTDSNSASKTETESKVICISDDENDEGTSQKKKKPGKSNECVNFNCKSGVTLQRAPCFVVTYYGMKFHKNKPQDVCEECYNVAVSHQEILAGRLSMHKSLMTCESFPKIADTVVLDSDEEGSDPDEPLANSILKNFDMNIEDALSSAFRRYDIDFQICEATSYLSNKLSKLEVTHTDILETGKSAQDELDSIRRQIYRQFQPRLQEVPSVNLPTVYSLDELRPPMKNASTETEPALFEPEPISPSQQTTQEVVTLKQVDLQLQTSLPPVGTLLRPRPRRNDTVYVMKLSFFGVWARGVVMDVLPETADQQTLYKVKMELQASKKNFSIKTVPGRHLAYPKPSPVRLPVGTRVIAIFKDEDSTRSGSYYSGLIAEQPKSNNLYRYLVFFDDGYAQYVVHNNILVVCESSREVWEDIHPDSREFIKKYLQQYPERPMVKLSPDQIVKTEWNGKWWIARVLEVDGSLVKMSFDADKRTEWIYRGSTRLAPLYSELANAKARIESGCNRRMGSGGVLNKNRVPYVEYSTGDDVNEISEAENQARTAVPPVRAVAKKSTGKKSYSSPGIFNFFENIGTVQEMQLPNNVPMPKRFVSHECDPSCISWVNISEDELVGINPLTKPLYCGWQRELPKYKKKHTVTYTGPCGRRLRTMEELHLYLRLTKSELTVDLFDFDFWVHALSEYKLNEKLRIIVDNEDISIGKEKVKIPMVNYVDCTLPGFLKYETQRKPTAGVPLNTDPNFLCGCDCTDDCQDKEKCACWQLTIKGTQMFTSTDVHDPNVGYVGYHYKRLQERVPTGIYECNQQCKCSKTCLNRVVQHPLQLKLQLYKTEDKGWGIRCINDIPKGTFICIYAGYLYTEQAANIEGKENGDEYLAELDYIEVVERMKDDYESDVDQDLLEEEDDDDDEEEEDSDDFDSNIELAEREGRDKDGDFNGFRIFPAKGNGDNPMRLRLRKRSAEEMAAEGDNSSKRKSISAVKSTGNNNKTAEDLDRVRLPSSFTARPGGNTVQSEGFKSIRKLYGFDERVYVMDANAMGNIGRYLNHSCEPNVFVQNVFVDTHDLRFPWVAFFALTYIPAGAELTWDYNYDVGSVPGKIIACRCGSAHCRKRLL